MSNYTTEQIQLINKTTNEFYSSVAESFSDTRKHQWEGWRRSLPYVKEAKTLLDLGCGNRRYSKFLEENNVKVKVFNYDNFDWDNMVTDIENGSTSASITKIDIIESLLEDNLNLKKYDMAVCFGVMHHIPTFELREKLLAELCKSKIAIISFWQLEKDERIFNKAQETTPKAQQKLRINNLEENDFFLGWQDREDVFRYCHNFSDREIEILTSQFNTVEEYSADKCNKYIIISK